MNAADIAVIQEWAFWNMALTFLLAAWIVLNFVMTVIKLIFIIDSRKNQQPQSE